MNRLARLDHQYIWHPFTQMREWLGREPIVIVEGQGAVLRDVHGREYLDANSSIWTNLHGHNNPAINAAIRSQLRRIAHSSALGLANEPASRLAQALVKLALPRGSGAEVVAECPNKDPRNAERKCSTYPAHLLEKVFFSDDGSTAMEVALKLAYEYCRRTGRSHKPKFLSLENSYHGDTVGAAALGHIDLFKRGYPGLMYQTDRVMAPYCYRCPFNRAKPERADARDYRKCNWECLDKLQTKFETKRRKGDRYAAFVFEPLIQGAAGMIPQPPGWLHRAAEIARGHGALLVADEVMTALGRTGSLHVPIQSRTRMLPLSDSLGPEATSQKIRRQRIGERQNACPTLLACQQESVQADFLALAKGLTGGYLPMAATLTTAAVFDSFLGQYDQFKTFFHGHSFTGNQLGAAAALANLQLLQSKDSIRARRTLQEILRQELQTLWPLPIIGDIRQIGLVAGIELVRNWRTREPFPLAARAGMRVCEAMAKRGVLTRPIGDVVVLMPPYCTTPSQVSAMVAALRDGIARLRIDN